MTDFTDLDNPSSKEIAEAAVKWFAEDPEGRRATTSTSSCQYTTDDGRHCAFGVFMKEEYQDHPAAHSPSYVVTALADAVEVKSFDDLLREPYQGMDLSFWHDLQLLHDEDRFWNLEENTLSTSGRRFVRSRFDVDPQDVLN